MHFCFPSGWSDPTRHFIHRHWNWLSPNACPILSHASKALPELDVSWHEFLIVASRIGVGLIELVLLGQTILDVVDEVWVTLHTLQQVLSLLWVSGLHLITELVVPWVGVLPTDLYLVNDQLSLPLLLVLGVQSHGVLLLLYEIRRHLFIVFCDHLLIDTAALIVECHWESSTRVSCFSLALDIVRSLATWSNSNSLGLQV